MATTTRDELLAVIKKMPKRTTYEEVIDRLALLSELKQRIADLRNGKIKTVPHDVVVRRVARWSR